MLKTPLCSQLGIELPIFSAGMGPIAGPELVAAVSNAGGLGVLGCTSMSADERAKSGLFLAFQYPVEIPGVNITPFLKSAVNARLKAEGKKEIDPIAFAKELKNNAIELGIENNMLSRSVNEGFSGGEKKRFEILQMSILKPKLSILDETDSGLDVDALKTVTEGVKKLKKNNTSMLIITHYLRFLDYIIPDFVHIIENDKIVKTGDKSLAKRIDISGYKNLEK